MCGVCACVRACVCVYLYIDINSYICYCANTQQSFSIDIRGHVKQLCSTSLLKENSHSNTS